MCGRSWSYHLVCFYSARKDTRWLFECTCCFKSPSRAAIGLVAQPRDSIESMYCNWINTQLGKNTKQRHKPPSDHQASLLITPLLSLFLFISLLYVCFYTWRLPHFDLALINPASDSLIRAVGLFLKSERSSRPQTYKRARWVFLTCSRMPPQFTLVLFFLPAQLLLTNGA